MMYDDLDGKLAFSGSKPAKEDYSKETLKAKQERNFIDIDTHPRKKHYSGFIDYILIGFCQLLRFITYIEGKIVHINYIECFLSQMCPK